MTFVRSAKPSKYPNSVLSRATLPQHSRMNSKLPYLWLVHLPTVVATGVVVTVGAVVAAGVVVAAGATFDLSSIS